MRAMLHKVCDDDLYVIFSSRRRHTRYWRDWSSDVCSSDLGARGPARQQRGARAGDARPAGGGDGGVEDRKSVVSGKGVDLGGRRIIKKKIVMLSITFLAPREPKFA